MAGKNKAASKAAFLCRKLEYERVDSRAERDSRQQQGKPKKGGGF